MTCQHKLKNSFYKFPLKFQIEITNAMISSYSLHEAELDFMNYISVKKKKSRFICKPKISPLANLVTHSGFPSCAA